MNPEARLVTCAPARVLGEPLNDDPGEAIYLVGSQRFAGSSGADR